MDRMAAAVGVFTCIPSDFVEPVDPEKPLWGVVNIYIYLYMFT